MENELREIFQVLQNLLAQHRQLFEMVQTEREKLIQADQAALQDLILRKQSLLNEITQSESQRIRITSQVAQGLGQEASSLTLPKIIARVKSSDPSFSDEFQSVYDALNLLIRRITDKNRENQRLLQRSLESISQMKRNLLGEPSAQSSTYSNLGQRVSSPTTRHLISKEA